MVEVKVKCFGCDALIEAADPDAVAAAFSAHGQQSHTWSYPEEAIRNYARNDAEAAPNDVTTTSTSTRTGTPRRQDREPRQRDRTLYCTSSSVSSM